MKACRDCKHQVSDQAYTCPNCGAMYPAPGGATDFRTFIRILTGGREACFRCFQPCK